MHRKIFKNIEFMTKREITNLWKKVNELGVVFEAKDGKVIERKLGDDDGDKVSKEVWKQDNTWKFCVFYAGKLLCHYTDIIGIDENGKFINGKMGGFYLGGYRPYGGDIYIDKQSAENAVKAAGPIDPKQLIIEKVEEIKRFGHNCLDSESSDYLDSISDEILEILKSICKIKMG